MSIVSTDYYLNTYKGTPASSTAELQKLIDRAEDMADNIMTSNISYKTVSVKFKKAICTQVEFLVNGGNDILIGKSKDVDSEKIGDYSYSAKKYDRTSRSDSYTSPEFLNYLRAGGFLDSCLCNY